MQNKDIPQDKSFDLISGEFSILKLDTETLKGATEYIFKEKPEFRKKNLAELQDNAEFQQLFNEYMLTILPESKDFEMLKSIKEASSNLGNNIALITDKDYKHALSPYKNPHAYIQQLDVNFFEQLNFNPDSGTMYIKGNLLEPIALQNIITRSNLKELDLPLLRSLYTTIYSYADKIDTDTVTIYMPTLAKHLGVNIRGGKPYELFSKIKAFDSVIGVFSNGSFYRLLTFLKYDEPTNSITFGSPYMNKILRALRESNIKTPKKGETYLNPHHSYLIHGTIANERNKIAVEIVNAIITLLHQRGVDKSPKEKLTKQEIKNAVKQAVREEFNSVNEINSDDKKQPTVTTMHKKISVIIEEIPIIAEALEKPVLDTKTGLPKPRSAREKNLILERAFSGAYALLKTKTDIYKYYKDLKITEIIPTITTIDQIIEISHTGINQNFQKM